MSTSDVSPYGPGGAGVLPGEPEDEWDEIPITPRSRMPRLTRLLLLGAVAAMAFGGGVLANREWGSKSASSSSAAGRNAAGFLSRLRGTSGSGGSASGAGALAGAGVTAGQIAYVKGSTIFVTDTSGNIVKVTLPAGLPITKSVATTAEALRPGQTVVVRGRQGSDGSVQATSVSIGGGLGFAGG